MSTNFWTSPLPDAKYTEWKHEKELYVEMRDGVHLSTDVLLPQGAPGKLPTVLIRTPYDKDNGEGMVSGKWTDFFLRQGFAVVVQNERGLFLSEGTFNHYLQGASTDGYDTVEWITKQSWSNGKVGTIGCSSSAEHQWPLAAGNHPGHAAMIPAAYGAAVGDIPGNDTRGAIYRGGVPILAPWITWYGKFAVTDRPLPPPSSTQEQRIRIRSFYALSSRSEFAPDAADAVKHLPSGEILREAQGPIAPFEQYITWMPGDPRWDEVEMIGAGDAPRVPALHIDTWHDICVGETIRLFEYLQDLGTPDQYLIVGPGPHCVVLHDPPYALTRADIKDLVAGMRCSDIDNIPAADPAKFEFGDLKVGDARYRGAEHGYAKLFLAWLNRFLKGEQNDTTDMPKVQLFVMNKGWIAGDTWPLKEAVPTSYYLGADGTLSRGAPQMDGQVSYRYDPLDPTPSIGGGCCSFAAAVDQRPVSARKDVLLYQTQRLDVPVTIAGPIEIILHISSSAKDTDFIVRLIDVHPDGKAINLNDDAFRVRYRAGFDQKVLMEQGEVYEIRLPNMVMGNRFEQGHRIRLEVASSCFPLYERNLNTGGSNYDETESVIAENSVHHGHSYPSRIVLPLLPD